MISTEKPGPVVVPHAAGASDGRARTEVRDSAAGGPRGGECPAGRLLGLLYWPILVKLVADWWDDPNYSHGFLVPVFSAYLVWQRRAALTAEVPRGSWRAGLPVLLVGLALLVLGEVGAERFLAASSLVVVLAAFMLLHLGPAIARRLAFPLAYLLFAIPIPAVAFYAIAFPLQQLSATNAAWTLDLLGVPVMLDGNVIHLSQITLGVTEACSGIRFPRVDAGPRSRVGRPPVRAGLGHGAPRGGCRAHHGHCQRQPRGGHPAAQALSAFPASLGEWQAREAPSWTATRSRSFRPTDYPVRREVDLAGRTLWLYVGYWDSQRKGASPHSPKKLSPRV